MSEIFRKIGFDSTEAIANLNALGEAVNRAGESLRRFDSSFGKGGTGGALAKGLGEARHQMFQFADGSKVAIGSLDDLVNQSQRAAQGLKPLNNGLQDVQDKAKKGRATFSGLAKSISSLLLIRAVIGVFNTFVGVLRSTTNEAREFGLAIAEVQTIAGQLNASNEALSRRVLDLSSSLGTDAIDTARGLYQVLSNQVVEASESFQFLEQAQRLAITTVASTAEAVDALSSVMNAYGTAAGSAAHVSDTLFEAVNVGRFTLDDIADILGRVTPLTAQMGITWEETAAAIATMTQSGVRADTAITQLRAIVIKLLKPTEAMTAIYEKWGVKDGPTAIQTFGGLQGVLQKLTNETQGSTAEMTEFFNEIRGLAGVLGLNVDNGERFAKVLNQIENSAGKAAEAFQGFQQSDAQQLTIEMNRLKNEVIGLGQALQPIARFFTTGFADISAGLRVIATEIRGSLDPSFALAQRNEAALNAARQASQLREKTFSRFQTKEYQVRTQAFLQSLAEQQKRFNFYQQQIVRGQEIITKSFIDQGARISSAFSEALDSLQKQVDSFAGRIQDSVAKTQEIQLEIDDEKLSQDLERAFSTGQKRNILNEDAERKTREALTLLSKARSEEELEAANAAAKRAIEAQKAKEEVNREIGFMRDVRQANDDVLKLLEARKKAQEDNTNRIKNQRQEELTTLERLKDAETQLKTLIEQRTDAIKAASEARGEELEIAKRAITDINNQIKGFGFDEKTFRLFETFDAEKTINDFNSMLNELDTGQINWEAGIDQLQQQLTGLRAKIQVEAGPGGDVFSFADQLGLQVDPNDFVGAGAKVEKETTKILNDQFNIKEGLKKLDIEKIALERNYKDALGRTLTELTVSAQRQSGFTDRLQLETAQTLGSWEGALRVMREATPELAGVADEIGNIAQNVQAGKYEEARQGITNVERTVSQLNAKGELTGSTYRTLSQLLGQQLPSLIDNLSGKADKLKALQDIAPRADVAEAWKELQESVGSAEAKQRGLLDGMGRLTEAGKTASAGVRLISDEFTQTVNLSNTAITNTASLGTTAAAQTPSVNALTQEYQRLAEAAQAAAQAQASAGGAVPGARFGRYFARGGLGMVKPLGTDTIPARIGHGEFVTNARSARKYFSQLNAMNQDARPVYRREGGSVTNVGDVNVTVQGGDTSRQTVRAIAAELNRELKRGTIRLGSLRKA